MAAMTCSWCGGPQCEQFCRVPLPPLPDSQVLGQAEHCPRCQERQPVRVVGMALASEVPVECKACLSRFIVKFWKDDSEEAPDGSD